MRKLAFLGGFLNGFFGFDSHGGDRGGSMYLGMRTGGTGHVRCYFASAGITWPLALMQGRLKLDRFSES